MSIFKSKIDRLSKQIKRTTSKRDNDARRMRERNSARENKIDKLTNKSVKDYEETQVRITKYNRQLDKLIREVQSEQTYVDEVAQDEVKEYLKDSKDQASKRTLKNMDTKKKGE